MSKRHPNGFTLIELVVLVVIISILAFVLITKFSFTASNLMNARVRLMSDVRYIQSLAVSRGAIYGIEFNPAAETYSLYVGTPTTKIKDPMKPTTDFVVDYTTATEFSGVDMVSAGFNGTTRLEFNWQGVPLDSGHNPLASDGTVVLATQSGTTTVRVTLQTGRVSYQ